MNSRFLLVLLFALLQFGCSGAPTGSVAHSDLVPPLAERKSVMNLTTVERAELVSAFLAMKTRPSTFDPTMNAYDYFVAVHVAAFEGHTGAHMAPNFLPWHRELLRRLEFELRRASGNPTLAVPYWNWEVPESVLAVFRDDFMGGDGDPGDRYLVKTGPFRVGQWRIDVFDPTDDEFDHHLDPLQLVQIGLQRNLGGSTRAIYPTQAHVDSALDTPRAYDVSPFGRPSDITMSFRNYVEGWWPQGSAMHNGIHVWMGGQMQTGASPNDPVFFLHHANIDRLWALWQQRYGDATFPAPFDNEELFRFPGTRARDTFDLRVHSGVQYAEP